MTILALTWIVTRLLGDQVMEMISWFLEISWMVVFNVIKKFVSLPRLTYLHVHSKLLMVIF